MPSCFRMNEFTGKDVVANLYAEHLCADGRRHCLVVHHNDIEILNIRKVLDFERYLGVTIGLLKSGERDAEEYPFVIGCLVRLRRADASHLIGK